MNSMYTPVQMSAIADHVLGFYPQYVTPLTIEQVHCQHLIFDHTGQAVAYVEDSIIAPSIDSFISDDDMPF